MINYGQQGERTFQIHNTEEGRGGDKRPSCLEEMDWWPHSPIKRKGKDYADNRFNQIHSSLHCLQFVENREKKGTNQVLKGFWLIGKLQT